MKKVFVSLVVAGGVIVGAGLLAGRYFSGQSTGTIIKNNSDSVSEVKAANVELKKYENEYFAVSIPSALRLRSSSLNTTESILAQYAFWSQVPTDQRQIAITVGKYSGGNMDEISFVKQRLIDSSYSQLPGTTAQKLIIQKNDGSEYAVFLVNGSRYSAIVASGQGGSLVALSDLGEQVSKSFIWK